MGRGTGKIVNCGAMRIQPAKSDLDQGVSRAQGHKGPGVPSGRGCLECPGPLPTRPPQLQEIVGDAEQGPLAGCPSSAS
jgi:hypothetical protein